MVNKDKINDFIDRYMADVDNMEFEYDLDYLEVDRLEFSYGSIDTLELSGLPKMEGNSIVGCDIHELRAGLSELILGDSQIDDKLHNIIKTAIISELRDSLTVKGHLGSGVINYSTINHGVLAAAVADRVLAMVYQED